MACVRQVALIVNCGYARVCIYQNSNPKGTGKQARQTIDTSEKIINFRGQFSGIYCFPDGYFDVRDENNMTQFHRDCNKILDGFKSKFPIGANRESYLNTFSHSKWCELSVNERKQHSLSKCARCFELHQNSQLSFPLKPTYHHKEHIVTTNEDALKKLGVKKFTTGLLTDCARMHACGCMPSGVCVCVCIELHAKLVSIVAFFLMFL